MLRKMRWSHSIRAAGVVLLLGAPASASAQIVMPAPAPTLSEAGATNFSVFLRGAPIGTEQIAVTRDAGGWMIVSAGRLGAPLDIVARRIEARYSADWKPLAFTFDGSLRGQSQVLHTRVEGSVAKSDVTTLGQTTDKVDTIDPNALLVLSTNFFGPYQALAERLKTATAGSVVPAYFVTQGSVGFRIGESAPEQIQTTARLINARRTHFTIMLSSAQVEADIWIDDGRMIRFSVPAQGLEVVREDIGAVSTRRVTISRANDEPVKIPSNGFTLAGTLSRPSTSSAARLPAVVLVGTTGQADRDGIAAGVPILGQIAGALADAGHIVLRYDKRGVGQSGGRAEAATLADYAEDVRAAVRLLSERKDVDPKGITVIGYDEGGLIAMLAAAKEKRIAAVGLIATPGMPGTEVALAQQQRALNHMTLTAEERQAKVDAQKKIHEAAISGKGLDQLPPDVRRSVDSPEYQNLLTTNPVKLVSDMRQPLLIVQGDLDTQVEPPNADRLAQGARARKNATAVDVAKVPGVNHLLVPANTGEVSEYAALADKHVSGAVTEAIVTWLQKTTPSPAR
jgi:uncharacterized protein